MFIIDSKGKRFNIDSDDFKHISSVSTFDECVYLEDAWIIYFNKYNFQTNEYEFIGEKRFYHEPTNDEILYEIGQRNMYRNDYVAISKIKVLEYED